MARDKRRMEVRVSESVQDDLKELAQRAGVSVNQIVQGVLCWAVDNAHVGEPERSETGAVRAREQAGCLFFGKLGEYWDHEKQMRAEEALGPDACPDKGEVYFVLDFTERRVIRGE